MTKYFCDKQPVEILPCAARMSTAGPAIVGLIRYGKHDKVGTWHPNGVPLKAWEHGELVEVEHD